MRLHLSLRWMSIMTLAAGLSLAAMGQTKGGSNAGKIPAPPPPTTSQPNQVIFLLSGNVIVEDGSALPEPVFIERICNGRISRDGRSDFKGYFTITINMSPQFRFGDPEGSAEMGGGSGLTTIGSISSRMPQTPSALAGALAGCEVRASLAGFRSSSVGIPMGELGNSVGAVNVGTIVLQRMDKVSGVTVSTTSLNAPKDAKKAYDKAHHDIENKNFAQAQQELEKAVQLYPRYVAAWQDLGAVYAQQNQLDKARSAFEQARTADAMFVPAYVGLASIALRESRWAEAAELSARATQLDGVDFPGAFYYNSFANYRLGNLDQAEKSARRAETLGAQRAFPQVNLLLGAMLANRRDYSDAADQLRAYLKAAPSAANAESVRQKLAEIEKLSTAQSKADAPDK